LLVLLVGTLWGFFIHANLRWRLGWLGHLISTPAFHHWHHTNDEHINHNYASMLPFMDKLFGTWYMPKNQWPPKYGIDKPIAPGLAWQLLQPLLPQTERPQAERPAPNRPGLGSGAY
jgi:sterol desaturase/sphingolipid hydroxylase (fatty acid hydroxylase superfamily)